MIYNCRTLENQIQIIDQRYLPPNVRLIGIAVIKSRLRRKWWRVKVLNIGLWLIRKSGVDVFGRIKWN